VTGALIGRVAMTGVGAQVWVVIPAYNEARVIGSVVAGVLQHYPHVVVVDDCATDATGAEASAAGATVLRHVVNLGQGAALQTGIRYALQQGASHVVTFDADGQHRVEDIAVLFARLQQTQADIVIGSRFLGEALNMPWLRRLVLKAAVRFTRMTSGLPLTDAHNGLRLLTAQAAQRIRIYQNRMAHASEIVDQLKGLGLKVAEAPITVVYTEYSLAKGQKLSNAFGILSDLLLGRLMK